MCVCVFMCVCGGGEIECEAGDCVCMSDVTVCDNVCVCMRLCVCVCLCVCV